VGVRHQLGKSRNWIYQRVLRNYCELDEWEIYHTIILLLHHWWWYPSHWILHLLYFHANDHRPRPGDDRLLLPSLNSSILPLLLMHAVEVWIANAAHCSFVLRHHHHYECSMIVVMFLLPNVQYPLDCVGRLLFVDGLRVVVSKHQFWILLLIVMGRLLTFLLLVMGTACQPNYFERLPIHSADDEDDVGWCRLLLFRLGILQ
jgi:hypothetical protein